MKLTKKKKILQKINHFEQLKLLLYFEIFLTNKYFSINYPVRGRLTIWPVFLSSLFITHVYPYSRNTIFFFHTN